MDGHDVRDVTMNSLRRSMGIVLQDPVIFAGTIRDNIAFGKADATDEEVEASARAVGVHELILRLADGYKTRVLPGGANLSLGQRQLISFARAMIVSPSILMLDEATAGIDTQTEILLQRGIAGLMEGRTAVVIAHRLSTIRDSDRIIVLKEGRIAEEGNHRDADGSPRESTTTSTPWALRTRRAKQPRESSAVLTALNEYPGDALVPDSHWVLCAGLPLPTSGPRFGRTD